MRIQQRETGHSRPGTTLMEVLVAVTLAIALSVRRMEHAGDLSGALQEASLACSIIQSDLTQAVQKPNPLATSSVVVTSKNFQLLRGILKPDGAIQGKLVVYYKNATPKGNFRLIRKFDGNEALLPGLYRSVGFTQPGGTGGPFIRFSLHLAVHDETLKPGAEAKGSEEAVLSSLVRIQGPEMVGSSLLSWNFMSFLNSIPFLNFSF